ncbi:MAG: oligosaccharide flippase family protein [Labilithrix sp.]|nr:oligosaccharide flippase family protein [Labilithrix sp.]MBX3221831.1 oligosaccharide flippase family protein [Labilithrix sp.]
MSIEKKAARGVAWNMVASVGTRVVSLVGTLVLTRFIAPDEYGEVSAAVVCVATAGQLTTFAFGQYLIAKRSPPRVAFQAAVLHVALGVFAMAVVMALRGPLGEMVDAPQMGRLVPGLAIGFLLERIRHVPERMLVRDLRFRTVAVVQSIGEVTFTGTAVALAPRWGGAAIVIGSVARSFVTAVLFIATAPRAEWFVYSPLEAKVVRSLLGYGVPIMLGSLADRASTSWDNLIISRQFGPGVMGPYNLSYSLAETPLTYVAERISDVLMPAFSKMDPAERPAAVVRSAGLMSLVVSPLGVGLGAVAPTVVHAFFNERWALMAPMLTILSVMTVVQPAPWAAIAYLQSERMTRVIMITSFFRAALLLALVFVLGKIGGPLWAAVGVGIGFAGHSLLTIVLTARATAMPLAPYLTGVARPLVACVPMFFSVTALHGVLASRAPTPVLLASEVLAGAVVYVVSAFVFARANVRELMSIVRGAVRKRS